MHDFCGYFQPSNLPYLRFRKIEFILQCASGQKNLWPLPRDKKTLFHPEKKKILKHFWAENNEKMSHWALAGKKTKSATLNKKVKRKMSTFSFFLSNFFSYSRNFFLKYIFISIFAFLSAGPFFLWILILLFCYNFEVNRH